MLVDTFAIIVMVLAACAVTVLDAFEVIYAINAGGEAHTDGNNIHYDQDPLMNKLGTASDYGKQFTIGRVPQWDEYLYQTERYHTSNFGYDIPVAGDGDYALVLKFSEVYFTAPNMKVFDALLNNEHMVVQDLDIYSQVGKSIAHDEIVYFTISRGRLYYKEEESEIRGGRVRIEFIKGHRDNPKVNAFVLFKGDLHSIPKLPPLELEQVQGDQAGRNVGSSDSGNGPDGDSEAKAERRKQSAKSRKTSGPRQQDPYALDDSTVMLPVFIAIGAFIPLLFCLCKL